jgi:uncharacterized protein (DUF2147 family)
MRRAGRSAAADRNSMVASNHSGRRRWLGAGLLLPLASWAGAVRAASADAILGTWLTDDGASKVEVSATRTADGSSVYAGKVIWLKEPMRDGRPVHDANNADTSQRERPILGLTILSGFRATGGGWGGGTVYSPRAGKSYPAELSVAPDGRLQLKVSAGILSKTDYWTR